jgi:perosamine synthetase
MASELALLGGPRSITDDAYGVWPDIRDADRDAVMGVLDRGVLTGGGSVEAPGFAREYADFVGTRHCLGFNAGTAALHACAVASGLGPGDEAIVPAFTYVASAMSMAHAGVTPVFADVELDTYLLDANDVEARITERTRAIVAVHLHGLPCDIHALQAIADRHGLTLIEDISQAHGAKYDGRIVGSYGRCAAGSLNATKNLPGGEGGMLVTNDDDVALTARRLRYMGEDPLDADPPAGRRYWAYGLGWNYRPQELPFAFARSQLRRLDGYVAKARRNARILTEGLREIPGIVPPAVPEGRDSIWYIYRVRVDSAALGWSGSDVELRDRIVAALRAEGLRATLWQHDPLPAFTAFRRDPLRPWVAGAEEEIRPWDPASYPVASQICKQTLVLGSAVHPIVAQSETMMRAYADTVRKVVHHLDELLESSFELPDSTQAALLLERTAGREGEPDVVPV